jgi:hypothetical protein
VYNNPFSQSQFAINCKWWLHSLQYHGDNCVFWVLCADGLGNA